MAQFDDRIVRLSIEVNGEFKVYEGLAITATGTRYANAIQNEAEITIANLSKADADYLLTETTPFNKNRTPKRIKLEAGRKSTGVATVFDGNIAAAVPSQPPDVILKFKCQANQYLKGKLVAVTQTGQAKFSQIAKGVAGDLGLELNFQATDKDVSNYSFTGGALGQVDKLGSLGAVNAYIDGNQLVVKDVRVPLTGHERILSADSGMIGIPELTDQGIKATYLLDNQTTLGGSLEIKSDVYPTANGKYDIFKLSWNITSRDVPFYWIAEGIRVDDKGKAVIPNNIKKKRETLVGNSNPSLELNPADAGSMPGTLRLVLRKFLQNVDGMLPCIVIAADAKREYATVQPSIMVVGTDDTLVSRAQIAKVPVFNIGAGGWVLSFPIKPQDPGWIIASDRDISLYLQASKAAAPNTNRFHSFEDGLFIPDAARKFVLNDDDADCVVIQSLDNTTRIALGTDKIKIIHPTLVEVTCPLVKMTGDLEVDGTITGHTDVVADTISGKTHHHSGVTTGGGNSGPPV